jgi:acetyltransferase
MAASTQPSWPNCINARPRPAPTQSRCSFPGWSAMDGACQALDEAHVARFRTPGDAVRGFMDVSRYAAGPAELSATPPALPTDLASADVERARVALQRCALPRAAPGSTPMRSGISWPATALPMPRPVRARERRASPRRRRATLLAQHRSVAMKIDSARHSAQIRCRRRCSRSHA